MDFDFKPNVINWLIVGLMAVTFIVLFKFIANNYLSSVPGLVAVANAI